MKKICFVTTIYVTYKCFLKKFSEYLYKSGEYDISLICNNEPVIADDLPEYIHYFSVDMKRGVSISAITAIYYIEKILREKKFDIVQYSTPNAAFYTSIAAKKADIPTRLYCQWGIRYMGFDGWKRSFFKYLEKKTCTNSTYIEAESHNIRDFSVSEKLYGENRSCVIWNGSACGVDLNKFSIKDKYIWRKEIREKFELEENDVVFAFAARLTADKGINELLQAFLNITDISKNAKLIVMGNMDNKSSLVVDLFKRSQKSAQIIFTGNVEDIEKYYAASDVFVAPSYREGFGLVVVEAEAMGLPAIVSDIPGQIDAIIPEKTGIACKVKDVATLENAMTRLLNDTELRTQLGKAAAEFAASGFEQKKLFYYLQENRARLIAEK